MRYCQQGAKKKSIHIYSCHNKYTGFGKIVPKTVPVKHLNYKMFRVRILQKENGMKNYNNRKKKVSGS